MIARCIAVLVVVALAACATRAGTETTAWTADISAMGGAGHSGSATAVPMDGGTHVTVNLRGGSSGGVHPWHVHAGVCESDGPIVGPADAYPALRPDAQGDSTADVHLDIALDPDGSYYINIHQSASELDTIVGCGELNPSG
jgi:hypothetical protein